MAAERAAWKASQPEIDIHRLVFIDETGASTKMARRYGRSPYGQRCVAAIPHGHWKTTTFVGALRASGMTAPMVLDGPMDSHSLVTLHIWLGFFSRQFCSSRRTLQSVSSQRWVVRLRRAAPPCPLMTQNPIPCKCARTKMVSRFERSGAAETIGSSRPARH